MIWARLLLALWKPVAALLGLVGSYFKGRADARKDAALGAAKADLKAHERMNDADTGADLTDEQRVERLRDLATKLGG